MAIYVRADADVTLPLKKKVKANQMQVALEDKQDEATLTMFGPLERASEGLYGIS